VTAGQKDESSVALTSSTLMGLDRLEELAMTTAYTAFRGGFSRLALQTTSRFPESSKEEAG
jgi:hypothetical protein